MSAAPADPGRVVVVGTVRNGDRSALGAWVAAEAGLEPAAADEVVTKGGVWVDRARGRSGTGRRREYDPRSTVRPGDRVAVYHDPAVLAADAPDPEPADDRGAYTVWFKPAGLLTQGMKFGDHASLVRRVERARGDAPFLVHRLDREAAGILVVARDRRTGGTLSRAFAAGNVVKKYRVVVAGDVAAMLGETARLDAPLDGKAARTEFRVVARDDERDRTWLDVRIPTGRHHQILRHLDGAGFPAVDDPRYGRGNKDRGGLRLVAVAVEMRCPVDGGPVRFDLPAGRVPWFDAGP